MNSYDGLENRFSGVLATLESLLKEKLDNFGIYYRIFSRVKTGASIENKLSQERYVKNPDKKIRDLFGVRIILYYQDDIPVCQKIFNDMLMNIRWKASESDTNTFDAMKNNGTFELPGFIRQIVMPELEGLRIEPTFEVQLRTVFFEGWHEAEHDMRYKELEIWKELPKEARKLNSILATLEMCDQYMVTLFDDVGHDFYKKEDWGQMIRYRYRLKTLSGNLDERLAEQMNQELAKKIFKWDKGDFIDKVLELGLNRLDSNHIVYLGNESLKDTEVYNPQIYQIFQQIKKENRSKREPATEKNIWKLRNETAFDVQVELEGENAFEQSLELVYHNWLKEKLSDIFPSEFEQELHPVNAACQGVSCHLSYDRERKDMMSILSHIGIDEPGKIWNVTLRICQIDGGKLIFYCNNSFAIPENSAAEVLSYSRPSIYHDICKNVGICDVRPVKKALCDAGEMSEEAFVEFLENPNRRFPVILVSSESEEYRKDPKSCIGQFLKYKVDTSGKVDLSKNVLIRKTSFVCHFYYLDGERCSRIAQKLGEDPKLYQNSVRLFKKDFKFDNPVDNYVSFHEQQMWERAKDVYALRAKEPFFYQSVSGPDAVRHEMIELIYQQVVE